MFRHSKSVMPIVLLALAASITLTVRAMAQSTERPWQEPSNISRSGAASRPAITVAPDGTLHVMWWDDVEGEQYARTTNGSETNWTLPAVVPAIFGLRTTDFQTGRIVLTPPRANRLVAAQSGSVHDFWLDDKDQLFEIQSDGSIWENAGTMRAESAASFDVTPDASGALHLVYVRPMSTAEAPAGIYYQVNSGAGWSSPKLVYSSQYFRSTKPGDVYLSATGNNAGQAVVTWSEPQTGHSRYAWTDDSGETWSTPQQIAGASNGRAHDARVALAPNGSWLMIWRDTEAGGCGYLQSQSTDGGQTWGAPEKILSDIIRCDEAWDFSYSADNRLWLTGRPAPEQSATTNAVTIAAWDGTAWSDPVDVTLSSYDSEAARSTMLNCLRVTIAGPAAGVVGCDASGDIWATRNAADLRNLTEAAIPVWGPLDFVSNRAGAIAADDLPALVTDKRGNIYAIWSQATGDSDNTTALFGALQLNDHWSRTALLLRSPEQANKLRTAVQPSAALDEQDRVHVVWSGGPDSPVFYSWAFARDFGGSTGWAEPVALPTDMAASSHPDIAIDSSNNHLYVIYARPFNEQRGIYLARSADGGSTWMTPTLVFDAAAAQWDSINKPEIAFDEQTNVLHATWLRSTLPGSTGAKAIYYARSSDQGATWSVPVKIVEGAIDGQQLSVIAADEVYVAWTQAAAQSTANSPTPYGVWGKFSSDGGTQWSPDIAIPDLGQVSGAIDLHSDKAGHAYLGAVGRSSGGESLLIAGKWRGQTWDTQEMRGLGQPAARNNGAAIAVAPEIGRLSALLHLWTLGQDEQGQFEVAATARDIDPVAIAPLPTFTPMPTMTPAPTSTPRPTATPRPQLNTADVRPIPGSQQGPPPLVLGGMLAALIVATVVAARTIKKRRS